jgi:4-oxalocrotonate tautomerase family enzyme
MPVINIESPKMPKEKRKLLVKELTAKASEIMEFPPESIMILIKEIDFEHVGVGGVLLSNMTHDKS